MYTLYAMSSASSPWAAKPITACSTARGAARNVYYENEYNVTCLLKQSLGFGRNEQMVQNLQGAHVHSPRPLDSLTSKVACKGGAIALN